MTYTDTDPGALANVQYRQIGKPLTRTDAPGKVTGRTPYAGDYVMPNMLHMRVLRADIASARLVRLDVSRARALKGVACVLTAADMPDRTSATDIPGQTGRKRLDTDQPVLVKDRVRYFGEPLALIAAETRDIADHAADLIEFELEPIPGVYDPLEALKPGAPLVYGSDNIVAERRIRKGDAEAGFGVADLIVEHTYRTPFQEHAFLEPEVGLAWVDENDVVNIRVSTQVIEHFRPIADAIGVPHNKVRVRGALVGGGFGGKEDLTVEVYLALLAKHTGRPVRLEYSREDSFVGHGKRHPFILTYRTGVTKEGRITALDVKMIADAGAYVYLSPYVILYALVAAPGPYRVDNLNVFAQAVATNNMYTSAFRGLRRAASLRGLRAADGRDRERARHRPAGGPPAQLPQDRRAHVHRLRAAERDLDRAVRRAGLGCARRAHAGAGPDPHRPRPRLLPAELRPPHLPARHLGGLGRRRDGWHRGGALRRHRHRRGPDLRARPDRGGGAGGHPRQRGHLQQRFRRHPARRHDHGHARSLHDRQRRPSRRRRASAPGSWRRAAQEFGVGPDEIDLAFNEVFVIDRPEKTMPLVDLVRTCAAEGIHRSELAIFRAPFGDFLDPETGQGQAHPDYAYGAHAVEVSVDMETGEVEVLKSVAAHDVGQCINPAAVEGQIQGGAQNGQGYALSEEMLYEEGRLVTPSFSEYLMPTAMDMPNVECIVLESRSGVGPFGAKGIGEPAMTAVAPAIANAVADAIGVRVFEMPITPERVVSALQRRDASP